MTRISKRLAYSGGGGFGVGKIFNFSGFRFLALQKNIDFLRIFLTKFLTDFSLDFISTVVIAIVMYGRELLGTSCRDHSQAGSPLGEIFTK